MDFDFGYEQNGNVDNDNSVNVKNNQEEVTDIDTGKLDNTVAGGNSAEAIDDDGQITDTSVNAETDTKDDEKGKDKNVDNTANDLVPGTSIEVGNEIYTVDEQGNLVDKNGSIFKEKAEVAEWLKGFDSIDEAVNGEININSIQDAIGVEIVGEDDKPIEFDNTPEGIKSYVDAVIESSKAEHYETAIKALYQKYPIIEDVLNYYVANGNSLDGYGEVPDRSGVEIDENNEAQQEYIIRLAWQEQNRKGDVDGYIQYLKSAGTLFATAQEELSGLQEIDAQHRQQLKDEAERIENEKAQKLRDYWEGVHSAVKSRKLGEYQIPETIIINKDGKKYSATPDDFFNYVYQVDKEGRSRYEHDLMQETPESRMNDELLRAYLKFVGGNYSNLVDMAINKENVNKLRLKAKERRTNSVRISKPNNDTKTGKNIDLGY